MAPERGWVVWMSASLRTRLHRVMPYAHVARQEVGVASPQTGTEPSLQGGMPAVADAALRIRTLGLFAVSLPIATGSRVAAWENLQARQLLKCLLAAPMACRSRDELMELLWPDQGADQARDALSHALSRLRRTLEPGRAAYSSSSYVGSDRDSVWLILHGEGDDGPDAVWIDHRQFERLASEALQVVELGQDAAGIAAVQERAELALQMYRGPFLPTDLYADWAQAPRNRCQRLWAALVRCVADKAVVAGALPRALLLLAQLVDACPDNEDAAVRLMLVQTATNQRGEALRTYQALHSHLGATFGTHPTRMTQRVAHMIRAWDGTQDLLTLYRQLP